VPPARAHEVAEILGVPVEEIRPDIFKPRKSLAPRKKERVP
jgi:hypothetical protein